MAKRPAFPMGERLTTWAVAAGAEKEALTNQYELLRLRVRGGVAIVYRKENGKQTWNPLAQRLRETLEKREPFPEDLRLVPRVANNPNRRRRNVQHQTLIQRDGNGCFFCGEEKPDDMTIEHLVPRNAGGPNHITNKFRACSPCNIRAGHLSAPEKIRIREARIIAEIKSTANEAASKSVNACEEICASA